MKIRNKLRRIPVSGILSFVSSFGIPIGLAIMFLGGWLEKEYVVNIGAYFIMLYMIWIPWYISYLEQKIKSLDDNI